MSVYAALVAAVLPVVPICEADLYSGDAEEYCTFNVHEIPDDFGDDEPNAIRYVVQLHWFLPLGVNPNRKKKQLKRALAAAGFLYPSVTNATDETSQHFVFETEYADGDV